jgi:hypothetical protein
MSQQDQQWIRHGWRLRRVGAAEPPQRSEINKRPNGDNGAVRIVLRQAHHPDQHVPV